VADGCQAGYKLRRSRACHKGSHSVTFHPTQVNTPCQYEILWPSWRWWTSG